VLIFLACGGDDDIYLTVITWEAGQPNDAIKESSGRFRMHQLRRGIRVNSSSMREKSSSCRARLQDFREPRRLPF
jgi:hypothetical protein